MTSWHSYPKVWNFGHAAVSEIFFDEVHIEEKIDGSQFSFGVFGGEIKIRSKGQEMDADHPEKMFQLAADTVKRLAPILHDGWSYRGEYLQKPKHNVLAYDRTPKDNIIIFDINTGEEAYLDYDAKKAEGERIGLECVPRLFSGKIYGATELTDLLNTTSILGGQKIEGFVAKNYKRFGKDKKALLGKFVSENFKEKHKKDWKEENPGQGDIIILLANMLKTPARWDKAIIHAKERGQITNSPKDIGLLLSEIKSDVEAECAEEIKEHLYKWASKDIFRRVTAGFPEYYKEKLLKAQFE